jgi:hypothetical protein
VDAARAALSWGEFLPPLTFPLANQKAEALHLCVIRSRGLLGSARRGERGKEEYGSGESHVLARGLGFPSILLARVAAGLKKSATRNQSLAMV